MSRRALAFVMVLAVVVGAASVVALASGIEETRLDLSGPRRALEPPALAGARGWIQTFGCMRHDLAVGVTADRRAFRLGARLPADEALDRVYTPLAARDDCDEDHPPKTIYALVEDDDSLGTTITWSYRREVAPPPVPAIVSGVIGFSAGHGREAAAARQFLDAHGLSAEALPLFVKDAQPGVLWVAILTALVGVHGLLFCGLGVWWVRRRIRRREASLVDEGELESEFFGTPEG